MSKYKIVGIINLFLGIPILLLALSFFILIIPKLSQLYSEFHASSQVSITSSYAVTIILLLTASANIFLGIKGISISQKKDKYFKYGLLLVIVTFLFSGFFIGILNLSVLLPIYNLTKQF
ncbi:hypothetical protein COV53_04035 [Candidatus Gottesmanbacteria bacterium CG11_big_fil_rev_8_21_14_0_20_37_11]|uniref:DUF1648 domain-containing protein n=3 Tax=Candidatus Gottesmaniibacteriota TaxID=1752720 RepID=A0A2M7RRU2_9BACT|nr:MAG: hypothetical protein AUJ73_00495 [Candidatus Gottesmanbacteria bacterium CG1_02_37_22]PIP32559.1 MAG: hypothetical protein COX23_04045 [Candidatus Gottesmanbacteria bacterium CG23_combo_of_CG06-09_8_20_14_all_37_19]PIR08241.1 MAG: hypothetical protein COV53_04035 [Candidatus Gottesmanbacteria bacterium CG11_big_fil_rev_8_21_14_0_20_37_11]PIZ02694.1 MAG: hypothetical protein COY59_03425 [Candidatus Gottesmanbacteria bacterium CG_4_10_14_0_8_um_filter_37_24]